MKVKLVVIILLGTLSVFSSCQSGQKKNAITKLQIAVQDTEQIIIDSIRFCESTYPYKEGLLIANFGTDQLNPLNTEGKGYILYYKGGAISRFIPTDGYLSAPKGMFEKDGYLFICDVNKIVAYNLSALQTAPQIIQFPKDELFVNDLAAKGDTLFASVTNTGTIYSIPIGNKSALNEVKPQVWCKVVGANGLIIEGNSMFIASYPPDGNTTPENVIYRIADINTPKVEKFITVAGQYDGIALSADKKVLYVTNWNPAGVYSIDMETRAITPLNLKNHVVGAADMTLINEKLYIPDLPNNRVIELPVATK